MERVDQETMDLLNERERRGIPEKVLRAILRELDYLRPDDMTRR